MPVRKLVGRLAVAARETALTTWDGASSRRCYSRQVIKRINSSFTFLMPNQIAGVRSGGYAAIFNQGFGRGPAMKDRR